MSADHAEHLTLRLPDAEAGELRAHLSGHGFRLPTGDARAVVTEVLVATAGSAAAWTAVGGTVVAYLRRNKGVAFRCEVEGRMFIAHGYSMREVRELSKAVLSLIRKSNGRDGEEGRSMRPPGLDSLT
ncbi:hypothetical protein [Actinomadura harenae]|nr:hypothetical protein [Actinomadura harenae]